MTGVQTCALPICTGKFDIIFADPPYDLPRFGEIPSLILSSKMLREGTIFVIEHSRNYDFSNLPHFLEHRVYGSVNFSIFRIGDVEPCGAVSSGENV